ncbi:MAG: alpha/beta hydrolase [Planctomycetota bacterium]
MLKIQTRTSHCVRSLFVAALTMVSCLVLTTDRLSAQPEGSVVVPVTDENDTELPWGATLFAPNPSLTDGEPLKFTKKGGVVYQQTEDYSLKCDVYTPVGDGPFPAILAVHGGGWRWGSKFMMTRHAWLMARSGYVVVAINYRHAPKDRFPAQIVDCQNAVRWMRNHAEELKIDSDNIGAYGYSAGGHLVALLGTSNGADLFARGDDSLNGDDVRVKAVVAAGAPCEFTWVGIDSPMLKFWFGDTRRNLPDLYALASPTTFASVDDPPFYFYHGEYDYLVPQASPLRLHRKLSSIGIESSFDVVKNSDHILPFSNLSYMKKGIQFFDRHLKED